MTPEARLRYATIAVPRYTSYPTAPCFHADVQAADVRGWLRDVPPDEPVSLYLHVPYCRDICLYCGCHTKATHQDSPLHDYADGLVAEIGLIAAALGRRQSVSNIHWGGGTPSLLPRVAFNHVMSAINRHFDGVQGADHAIELDPRSVTADLAATLIEASVTRASLGVQDFAADVQVAIGRVQPFDIVARAVGHLRAVGISAINFDLMYGLPQQTIAGMVATVKAAATLDPDRIALFGYAHVPWIRKQQRLIDAATLPGTQARLDLEAAAREALTACGYQAIGLDHFARLHDPMAKAAATGELHRNFQGYTTDAASTLIGIGASAISQLPQGFAQNAPDVSRWRQAIAANRLPVAKGKPFEGEDRLRGDIIEHLMCRYEVDLAPVAALHGSHINALADSIDALQPLVLDGLVRLDGTHVTVTAAGRPFVRVVAAAFDAYLPKQLARHSVAV